MLYCGDFCTQLTTLKSTHNKQAGRFCCRLALTSRSCAGGELCYVASMLKSNGQTQVLMAASVIHMWYFDVRTDESILGTSSLLQRLMTVQFHTISSDIIEEKGTQP